jgi:hypothetical protein
MPFNYSGLGTKYYGKRDYLEDGSFVTTEWFVIAHIPIIPLGSFRVVPTGKSSNLLVYRSTQYLVKPVPMNWLQIRNVYITTIVILGTISGAIVLLDRTSSRTSPRQENQIESAPQNKSRLTDWSRTSGLAV